MLTTPMTNTTPHIHKSWKNLLQEEFSCNYFNDLKIFLKKEDTNKTITYPPKMQVFAAFNRTPLKQVKVVILGQDPYHGEGQANGLCFSVADGIRQPPSLKNIFKEMYTDLGIDIPISGNLEQWADQGVFLLNSTLTVRHKTPGSHQKKGWETFTDQVIQNLSNSCEHLVFILWGKFAQNKSSLINENQHLVLKAPHPSPFSAHTGFYGSKPFSKTNEYLGQHNIKPIDWRL